MKKVNLYKIISFFITILFLFISFIAIIFTIKITIFKEMVPELFGYRILQVVSGSMKGTLEIGDVILIKEYCKSDDIKIGDIITFKLDDSLVTHRVVDQVKVNDEIKYITKGDSNVSLDVDYVEYKNINGKYVITIPFIGKIINIMKTSIGMTTVLFVPILALILEMKKSRKKEKLYNLRREKRMRYEFQKELNKLYQER